MELGGRSRTEHAYLPGHEIQLVPTCPQLCGSNLNGGATYTLPGLPKNGLCYEVSTREAVGPCLLLVVQLHYLLPGQLHCLLQLGGLHRRNE